MTLSSTRLPGRYGNSDLERKGFVLVSLRTVEYYSGILFLTTNRIEAFDEVFRARNYSALFCKELDRDKTIEF